METKKTVGFFLMAVIAAVTSVMSLIEVATQFAIQKFRTSRKVSAFVVTEVCLPMSIPIGISLVHTAILEESGPPSGDWLTYFDKVTNTVLMPVCAFFSCAAADLPDGWSAFFRGFPRQGRENFRVFPPNRRIFRFWTYIFRKSGVY